MIAYRYEFRPDDEDGHQSFLVLRDDGFEMADCTDENAALTIVAALNLQQCVKDQLLTPMAELMKEMTR